MSNQELIVVKQLPIIEEQLKQLSEEIDKKVANAKSLVCAEETVKEVKQVRADLNKEFKEVEDQRKAVKEQVLKPYNEFEAVYKTYISNKYKKADSELKIKIDTVENELKVKKEQEIKDYFEEYKKASNIDFITYNQAKINVTLSASMKSLKKEVKAFIDKTVEDLNLINTQNHKEEILVEYKRTLNVSNAITTVTNRNKEIEEEKRKRMAEAQKAADESIKQQTEETSKALKNFNVGIPKADEPLRAPIEEKQEEILTLKFTVRGTKTKLKQLKEFLESGGYDYE